MRHQPLIWICDEIVGTGEGPGVWTGVVVHREGEDGVGEGFAGWCCENGAVELVEDCGAVLEGGEESLIVSLVLYF